MLRRIQVSIALILCFIATGAQWDLVQTFAWGRMVANYSQAMPLAQAVAKTFDGEMCNICRMVANAQQQERSRSDVPEAKIESKIFFFFQDAPRMVVEAPCAAVSFPSDSSAMTEGRSAPPVPPPRASLA